MTNDLVKEAEEELGTRARWVLYNENTDEFVGADSGTLYRGENEVDANIFTYRDGGTAVIEDPQDDTIYVAPSRYDYQNGDSAGVLEEGVTPLKLSIKGEVERDEGEKVGIDQLVNRLEEEWTLVDHPEYNPEKSREEI